MRVRWDFFRFAIARSLFQTGEQQAAIEKIQFIFNTDPPYRILLGRIR